MIITQGIQQKMITPKTRSKQFHVPRAPNLELYTNDCWKQISQALLWFNY